MKPWRSVNLRVCLPALVFLLFATLSGVIVLFQYLEQRNALEKAGVTFALQELTRLQRLIAHEQAETSMAGAEKLIRELGAAPEVKTLIAVDADAKVQLSLRSTWSGRPAAEVASGFDLHEFERMQSSGQAQLFLLGDGGDGERTVAVYFPLTAPPAEDEPSVRSGGLFLLYDLSTAQQQLLFNVLRDGGFLWLATFVVMIALLFALRMLVSRPALQMQEMARQLAQGNYSARLHYLGKGEFAELAQTFNVMVERLAEGHASLVKQKNLHRLLSAINEIIHRYGDAEALFAEICRIAVRYEGISLAWVGQVFDDGRSVRIRAGAGAGQDWLYHRDFRLPQDTDGEGPLEQVMRTKDYVLIDDIFAVKAAGIGHETARAGNIRSVALFPILQNGVISGLFTLYSDAFGFFTGDVAGLLKKTTEDIAYALDAIDSERKRRKAERMLAVQRDLLQAISEGSPLSVVLADLCASVEALLGQEACSSILLAQEGRLRVGAAPNLPGEYRRAVDGLKIGPSGGICGRVAASGEAAFSADYPNDAQGSISTDLARSLGLRACWSIPIKSSESRVLGVFAVYYSGPREPDADRREVVDRFVYLAGIAIERRQAEEALREREENLSITLNSIGDAVIVTDQAGKVVRMNPVAENLTGWPFEAAAGRSLDEVFRIIHSESGAIVESPVEKVLREGRVVGLANDTSLVVRDGGTRQIADCAAPIRDKRGAIIGAILVFHDVTEEYRMQSSLRHSEMLLKHHIENTPLAAILWDPQCKVVQWNNSAERIFGYPAGEAVGRHALQLIIPPDSQEMLLNQGVHAFLIEPGRSRVTENLTREGRRLFCEWYHTPLRDDAGALLGVASLARDVTERRIMDDIMRGVAEEAGGRVGQDFFNALAQQLAKGLQLDYAFVGVLCDNETHIQTLAIHCQGRAAENAYYALAGTPCDEVVKKKACVYSSSVCDRFPQDTFLAEMGVESYAAAPVRDATGKVLGLLGVLDSKTMNYPETILSLLDMVAIRCSAELQRMKTEEELRLAAIAFETQEAILIADANADIVRVNKAFSEITGYAAEEVIGRNPRLLNSGVHSDDFFAAFWNQLSSEGQWQGEIWNRRKSGEIFPIMQSVTAVRDDSGKVSQYVAAFLDISEQKQAEREIQRLAYYDILTNLPNRRLLMERLQQELSSAARHQSSGALLFLDLDHFKTINDALGHSVGDMLLKQVAERLSNAVRA
ncbi:MAG TPA: PAS domain S-box protein, partial [Methylococcaceae bacterium]|nr:PAS domain S-box protein [Methylococcaceae bacterium]